jgi:polyisoprenoid-binding protein YceI
MRFRTFLAATAAALVASEAVAQSATAQSATAPKSATARSSGTVGTVPHLRYVVAPTGNEARYRVREQLISFDFPNDAVGSTKAITGTLVVDQNGTVVRDSSRIVVNVSELKSDQARRDAFIKRKTMETDKFPTVELVPRTFRGIASRPAGAEPTTFDLVGDLTVHGATHPTEWTVTAHADGADIVGTATTAFTFKDLGLDQPRVPVVLSVADTIKLEYDLRFTPATKSP